MLINGTMLELYADARLADIERLSQHHFELRNAPVHSTTRRRPPFRNLLIVSYHNIVARASR